eukprot:gene109-720_t
MAASALFACTNCHSRHPFHELSTGQQLCRSCRGKHPLVSCTYCRFEFHLLKKVSGGQVCKHCSDNLKAYGQPKSCQYCHKRAAFRGSRCASCSKSEKKYGPPVVCEQCKVKCAFAKGEESRSKVDGKLLCMLCTMHFKKHQQRKIRKEKRKRQHSDHHDGNHHSDDHSRQKRKRQSESNDHKAANEMKSKLAAVESASHNRSPSNSPMLFGLQNILRENSPDAAIESTQDSMVVDQIAEIVRLKDEVAALKRQLQLKEKTIIEKDKKIHELEAARWEHGKEFRDKTKKIEKEFTEMANNLREENWNLKRQLSQASKLSKSIKSEAPT